MRPEIDERLRLLSLEELGPHAPALAREALEHGALEVHRGVTRWQGSLGLIEGHRVVVLLAPELRDRVRAAPAVVDALTAAVASALSAPGQSLVELALEPVEAPPRRGPYRGA